MRHISVGPPLRIGAMAGGIVLLADIAVSFAIDSNDLGRWLLAPAVGVAASALTVAMGGGDPKPEPTIIERAIAGQTEQRSRRLRLGSMSVAGALALTTVVVGGGGVALTGLARYATAWVTGNEDGPDRLVAPKTRQRHGIRLTVTHIEQTPHFTRVTVQVENESTSAVTLPLDDGNCELIAGDGTATEAQPFRSKWNESVAPGSAKTGVVVFGGHLPASANRARISFDHLFAATPDAPESIVIANLQLLPG